MYRNYFEVNGKRYYTGTIFIVNHLGSHVEATFVCYDLQHSWYVYKIGVGKIYAPDNMFWRDFISVTNKTDQNVHMPTIKTRNEFDIDGMLVGWTWYVILMLISTIFKDAIGLWVFISIVFFAWRYEKINKEGTYIEW